MRWIAFLLLLVSVSAYDDCPDEESCGIYCQTNGTQCILREYFLTEGSNIPWGTYPLPHFNPVEEAPCFNLPSRILHCIEDGPYGNVIELHFTSEFNIVQLNISEMLASINTMTVLEYNQVNLTGSLPTAFGKMSQLQTLIIKDVVGDFSSTFDNSFDQMYSIRKLDFSGTSGFHGDISNSDIMFQNTGISSPTGMFAYNFSHNQFWGQLPSSAVGRNIYSADFSFNLLNGTLPEVLIFDRDIVLSDQVYDFSNNYLTGTIPASFLGLCQFYAQYMILSYNDLGGPLDFGDIQSANATVQVFLLDNNPNFGGELPLELSRFSNLTILDVSNCGLVGKVNVSYTIGNIDRLKFFAASNNSFSGNVQNIVDDVKSLYVAGNLSALDTFYIFAGTGFVCPYEPRDSFWNDHFITTDYPESGDITFMCVDCAYAAICPLGHYCQSTTSYNTTTTSDSNGYRCLVCENSFKASYYCMYDNRDVGIYAMQYNSVCEEEGQCPGWGPGDAVLMPACENSLFHSQCQGYGGIWADGFVLSIQNMPLSLAIEDQTTESLDDISELNIQNINSLVSIPNSIYMMRNLSTIFISCSIGGTLPSEIGNIEMLMNLVIEQAYGLTGSIPKQIAILPFLDQFVINGASLTGTIPVGLFSSRSLRNINLSNMNISGNLLEIDSFTSNIFANTLLYSLRIAFTDVGGPLPLNLHNYPHLQYVYLNNNKFVGSIPLAYSNTRPMFSEWLYGNSLGGNANYYVISTADYLLNNSNPETPPPEPPPRYLEPIKRDYFRHRSQELFERSIFPRTPEVLFKFVTENNFICAILPLDYEKYLVMSNYTDFYDGPSPSYQRCGPCSRSLSPCFSDDPSYLFCQSTTNQNIDTGTYQCVSTMTCEPKTCGLHCLEYGYQCNSPPFCGKNRK